MTTTEAGILALMIMCAMTILVTLITAHHVATTRKP